VQLARKYHPDTNPDKSAREKFQEIQEAYDVRTVPLFFSEPALTPYLDP
jgi:curved DNA-binding protein CbpA